MSTARVNVLEREQSDLKALGFWVYLMTDCLLFAALFATYVILRSNTYGGPTGHDLFSMPNVLLETLTLLTSSFTAGLAVLAVKAGQRRMSLIMMAVTFLLGAVFLALELNEFSQFAMDGHGWWSSAFLSAFFTLVGTHGLHITMGLLWLGVLMVQYLRRGATAGVKRRMMLFGMFWHFLDVVWIFIFTIVYLMGVI
ncbi:MAG TPA: cytochrome o ubiquinol oxidase subunit III [Candidatus Saccharimonadales bacterium]